MARIEDRRTEAEKAETCGFIVCTDRALSGLLTGRSLYAVAIRSMQEAQIVMGNAERRTDMMRPRHALNLPRLRPGDHLSVVGPSTAARWYERGAF